MLREAPADATAFADFPISHWKIWSTNPLERVNKQIKRRTDVVGVFPTPAALLRLPARCGRNPRRMASRRTPLPIRSSMALLDTTQPTEEVAPTELLTA
jgi:putative transposase